MSARSMESLIYDAPDGRFAGIRRDYGVDQVVALRGTLSVRYTLAEHAAKRLWHLLTTEDYVHALGAMTGGQAVQMVRAGLNAIYLSGWQVAADSNGAGSDLPRSEPLPSRQRAGAGAAHQPRAATRRPDRQRRRVWHHGVVRADRGGRGGRLRRAAQRLRDRKGLHRCWRRRHSLRGPARVREEVRPHGRQGADPDPGAYPQPQRGTACGRRLRDGNGDRRADGCG